MQLDSEKLPLDSIELTVQACDVKCTHKAFARVIVKVIDENDNYPIFKTNPVNASVSESIQPGENIASVLAYDKDKGKNGRVLYFLLRKKSSNSEIFLVNINTGKFIFI